MPVVSVKAEPDEEAWGKDGLTFKQRRFVKAYVGPAAGNATKAAEMAGYRSDNRESLKATASENLTKPNVQRALARAMAKHRGGKRWTLAGIIELASVNIDDYLAEDGSIDIAKARAGGAMGMVKKIEVREMGEHGRQVKVETYSRLDALLALAKIHGTLIDRHEHTGKDGQPIEHKHAVDYDSIEAELRSIGGRMAGRATSDN